jgi:hypothetical protein
VNFANLFRAFDAVMALRDAARKIKNPSASPDTSLAQTAAAQGLAGQIETRLTNVVVAALTEAVDRDLARLELERAQMEEQRRRAEDALRMELRRQAIDREVARLRLLAATALVGWSAAIVVLFIHPSGIPSRIVLGVGWLLLLAALAGAFNAQGRVEAMPADRTSRFDLAAVPLWLMVGGLAATAISLLL